MQGNLSLMKNRLAQTVAGRGSALIVTWTEISGGELNESTGALVGGVENAYSGVMTAIAVEEVPRMVLRQYQEIQAGDLIVECAPDPVVTVYPGQAAYTNSGTLRLATIAGNGVQFLFNGRLYVQAKIGEDLAGLWNLTVQNVPVLGGMLLRRQT